MATLSGKKKNIAIRIDASSTNVPTTFTTAAGSKILTGLAQDQQTPYNHIKIQNELAGRVALCFAAADDGTPGATGTNTHQMYVAASSFEFRDYVCALDNLFIRSDTGSTISTGIIIIELW